MSMEGGVNLSTGSGRPATGTSAGDLRAFPGGPGASLRALLLALVLALALGAALYEGFIAGPSAPAPAGLHPSSLLRTGASAHRRGAGAAEHRQGLSSLPASAQGPISEALGAQNPAYHVVAAGAGRLAAASPAQHLRASFNSVGVSVSSGAARVGLSLGAVGYGNTLVAVGPAAPRGRSNRVSYARAGLIEWYASGPLGLEQRFTIPRPLSAHSAGPLTLALALSGNVRPALAAGRQSVTFEHGGRSVLRYSGLRATDASGRALRGWLELKQGRLLIRLDAAGARYPLRIDPFVQQGEKLTGSGERGEEGDFGYSVAVSSEKGEYAVIGGPADNGNTGAAWVFTRSGTTWAQQAILTPKEEGGAGEFGKSVAISEKGETALVGGPGDDERTGAAWVFTRSEKSWTQQAKLTGKEETGRGEFGFSVSLAPSEKGEDALIGAPANKERTGAAWVFVRKEKETSWTQQALITGKEATEKEAEFGYSVSLSPKEGTKEGDLALIGGPGNKEGVGAAWIYLRKEKASTWEYQAIIAGGKEESGDGEFGKSVAISAEGTFALIGGPSNKEGDGAAWVYTRSGTAWSYQAMLTPKSGEQSPAISEFGSSVALAAKEGNYALIGTPLNGEGVGAAWVFLRESGKTEWKQQGEKLTGGGENGNGLFGFGVALSATGEYALMGGYHDSAEVGAGWVFFRESGKTTWTQQGPKLTGKEEIGAGENRPGKGQLGYSVALAPEGGGTALIGGPSYRNSGGTSVGAAWVFTRTGSIWTQQGLKLTGQGEVGAGEFGDSVALSANGGTALVGGYRDNGGVGAVWVFTRSGEKWTQQGEKLTAKEEVGEGQFGVSVTLSEKGEYALIGGPGDNSKAGAAWVFTRSGEKWTPQGEKLTPKSGEEIGAGEFGESVALSAEGNTALVGANGDNTDVGAAWVFTRSGEKWTPQSGKLTGKEEVGEGVFGAAVALSGEGNVALIGGPGDSEGAGAAWTFTRSGSTWTAGAKLTGKEAVGKAEFGASVALSAKEGNYALIGGPLDHEGAGGAWLFTRSGMTWTQLGEKLTGKEEVGAGAFGSSVALSAEGNNALVGGDSDNNSVGAGWVFVNTSPTAATKPATSITQTTATLNASVNPNGLEVSKCEFEYGETTSYGSKVSCSSMPGSGSSAVAVSSPITGLTNTRTYHFRVVATNKEGMSVGSDETFKTLGPPTVLTEKASPISQTTATLNAGVNPNGGEVTKCEFEWGESSLTKTASCSSLPGAGQSPVAVSSALTGLSANTTYRFRISATNAGGTTKGAEESFKTLPNAPTVVSKAASSITQTTATLNATVNPSGGEVTSCEFEYGETIAYGSKASCSSLPGKGTEAVAVSAAISGLSPNTAYHFRISATNGSGTSKGTDETLKTLPSAPGLTGCPLSGITQTSASLCWKVNPNEGEVSECKIEYGTTISYGSTAACSPVPKLTPIEVAGSLSGLLANTTYHFRIVVTNAGGTSRSTDETFKTLPNPPTVVTKAASPIAQTTATLNATVNPEGSEVSRCEFQYGETNSYGKTAPCTPAAPGSSSSPVEVSASISGLGANKPYHFRIVADNASGESKGLDGAFTTLANAPAVVTKPAFPITQTTATPGATVNPEGGEVTKCEFEYGETTSYGSKASCASLPGKGTEPVAVSATISGLSPNTTYHFRISATNAGGTSRGMDETARTLPNAPTVITKAATSVTAASAVLNASVNPNGGESKCEFEYGETTSYGKIAACSPEPEAATSPVLLTGAATPLKASTTYHFRIVASNAGGTSQGAPETFTTPASPPTAVTEPATGITSKQATLNATVNPNGTEVGENCYFEVATAEFYEASKTYESTEACSSLPGKGVEPVAVHTVVGGLNALTVYHFRIVAINANGYTLGSDRTFTTLPNAPKSVTKAATSVTQSTATLNATVDPESGEVSKCEFEYGETTSYGKTASCSLPEAENKVERPVAVSAPISGLTANTTYHFRISATNPSGTSSGADETLKTLTACTAEGFCASFGASGESLEGHFSEPEALAVDSSGNVWVADSGHDRVLELNSQRKYLRQFGSEGSGEGQFKGIKGIATNKEGDVYVSDYANNRVQEFSPSGAFIRKLGSPGVGAGQLAGPTGIAVDSSGNVWVLNSNGVQVQEFSSSGEYLSGFGSAGPAGSTGLAISAGHLYVVEELKGRVQEFSTAGSSLAIFDERGSASGKSALAWAIVTDPTTGNLYVTDIGNDNVQEFSPSGGFIASFGSAGYGAGQLRGPKGAAVAPSGYVFIADAGNNRIEEWAPGG